LIPKSAIYLIIITTLLSAITGALSYAHTSGGNSVRLELTKQHNEQLAQALQNQSDAYQRQLDQRQESQRQDEVFDDKFKAITKTVYKAVYKCDSLPKLGGVLVNAIRAANSYASVQPRESSAVQAVSGAGE